MTSLLRRPSIAIPLLAICALGVYAFAQDKQDKQKPKPDPYAVVKVDSETRVIRKASLKALKAEISRDYKQALKDYNAAVKEARKNKTKHDSPKPKKAKLKILKATCKDEEAAKKFVEQLEAKERKKREAEEKKRTKGKSP